MFRLRVKFKWIKRLRNKALSQPSCPPGTWTDEEKEKLLRLFSRRTSRLIVL
jgi:hypothetical protein